MEYYHDTFSLNMFINRRQTWNRVFHSTVLVRQKSFYQTNRINNEEGHSLPRLTSLLELIDGILEHGEE